ncbi:hypothetical protein [Noviherbaspirillum autotrophicum]|nr:hypothetical protein [Noviherbaspirillum autotrophicum]
MLTATYSLVAIAAEQDAAHRALRKLRHSIQNMWYGFQNIDFSFLESALAKLGEFDEYCRKRKLEMYVIPVVRNAKREADALLAELDALSDSARSILHTACERLSALVEGKSDQLHGICLAMESYCDRLHTRLTREEDELFPMLRRLLSVEEWFGIAAQFLSDDADTDGRKRYPLPQFRLPASAPRSTLTAS